MLKDFLKKAFQFSIRTKILFLGTGVIALSYATYLPYILNTFLSDKRSYIYDSALSESHEIQLKITQLLEGKQTDLLAFSLQDLSYFQTDEFKKAAMKTTLLQYERYSFDGGFKKLGSTVYEPALRNHSLEKINVEEITLTPWEQFPAMIAKKKSIDFTHFGSIPVIRTFYFNETNKTLHYGVFVGDEIADQFSRNSSFSNSLMNLNGTIFETSSKIQIPITILDKLSGGGISEGVIGQEIDGKNYLIAFSKIAPDDWLALSVINEEEAYKVAHFLLKRTIAFAGIIISLAIIFGTLLAKSLTNPIDDLVEGTDQISKGNFNHFIPKRNEDELGQLADSFNYMSKELLRYIEEVKEKTRMENELAVAQLVQNSFFPDKKVITESISVVGHYASASECGGDWWGTRTIQDKTLLFIADATGHGVPAALITATANCVANLLPQICEEHPELLDSPGKILDYFNSAVYKVGGKILMTFFIGIYDKKTQTLKYANASHNPPYLYRFNDQEPQKSDITLLLDAEGERLGHIENPKYTEGTTRMNDQDVLVMITDGIVEAENHDKKAYGERRFIKSILSHVKSTPEDMLGGIIKDAEEFLAGAKPDDDVTLIIAKREAS